MKVRSLSPRPSPRNFLLPAVLCFTLLMRAQAPAPGILTPDPAWVKALAGMQASPPPASDAFPLGGSPPNDDCSTAIVEELVAGVPDVRTGDNTGASDNYGFGPSVWEGFILTQCMDVTVAYCGTTPAFGAALPLLFVGCPVLENLVLIDNNYISTTACGDGNFTLLFPQLPPGTYYFGVLASPGSIGPYTLTLTGTVCTATPPGNDDCNGAIALTPGPLCDPYAADVFGAPVTGGSLPGSACSGSWGDAADDVWFSFVATAEEMQVVVTGSAGFDAVVDLRDGDCASSGNLACQDITGQGGTETIHATGLVIGNTYYVRVFDWYAGLPFSTQFEICIIGPPPGGCEASAGTLLPDDPQPCLSGGIATVSASQGAAPNVPPGFEVAYVLTTGASLTIEDLAAAPVFDVFATGLYTIHTLVYDPNTLDLGIVVPGVTTGAEVLQYIADNGICASLDVAGAPFEVIDCTVPCDADAGTLSGGGQVCLVDGEALLSVIPNGDIQVPAGHEVLYVLTSGPELTIIGAGPDLEFIVNATGLYTIHTLVYDPNTLDLGIVVPGVTTGAEVLQYIADNGICASLDVAGAPFEVIDCTVPCDADAGTLSGGGQVCLVDGEALLSVIPNGDIQVPAGHEVLYVLTSGPELTIIGAGPDLEFIVNATGLYTIHTLVYDPNTLDLGIVVPGVTTGAEVLQYIADNGICASLDVAGAPFEVIDCTVPCDADAGTLTAFDPEVCLQNGVAVIAGIPGDDAIVPPGYLAAYVLTQGPGLVIVGLNGTPVFTVSAPGVHTIHTVVFDPATIDPGFIQLGETTAFEVEDLLIQGGGSICGALDMSGAVVLVNDCTPANDLCTGAIALNVQTPSNCPGNATAGDNTYATIDLDHPGCDFSVSGYTDVWYTFNAGANGEVTITFDPGTMTDWGVVVYDACGGSEVACEVLPTGPFTVTVDPGGNYAVRVFSNLQFGTGGAFAICVSGESPTVSCDGGEVSTTDGAQVVNVCQDTGADVVDFANTSGSNQNYAYIVTAVDGTIVSLVAGNSLDFNSAPLGTYRVYGISYNGTLLNIAPGGNLANVGSTGECIELSTNHVTVNVEICTGMGGAVGAPVSVYPNPSDGSFFIHMEDGARNWSLELLDIGGRVVHQVSLAAGPVGMIALPLAGRLAPGTYVLRMTSELGRSEHRLVVR